MNVLPEVLAPPAGLQRRYIVAHNRDRDFYQVALALEEADALETLVTDYFVDGRSLSARLFMARVLADRYRVLIQPEHIRNCWDCVLLQLLDRLERHSRSHRRLAAVNRRLGVHARSAAIAAPASDLLLYHGYALESFEAPQLATRKRHLFVYHPHPRFNHAILKADFERFGIGKQSLLEEGTASDRLDRELALADHVLCASSLTRRSVEYAAVTDAAVSIVPYGAVANRIGYRAGRRSTAPLRFLFAGQGIQRKGIHHLLMVWEALRPSGAELVLVCSRNQDGILDCLPPNVTLLSNQTTAELAELYWSAHCFVLPALIEGFGLVLLEALQAGCYTIFSEATGLADCDVPTFAGQQVEAGDLEGLGAAIERVIDLASSQAIDHDAIAAFGATLSAEGFRAKLRESLAAIGRAEG